MKISNGVKYPSYLNLSQKEIESRIDAAYKLLRSCQVCPRKCGTGRLKNKRGFCHLGVKAMVSSAGPHFGEERYLVGRGGSGTIFFTYCNLACVYCQNYDISQFGAGREVSEEELARMMIGLQRMGCHNINLVTPTSQVPQILAALPYAIKGGLKVPLVYNTNGYDSLEILKLLDGIVDIYMPDFKYSDDKVAIKYSQAPDYFEIAKKAISEMYRQVGDLKIVDCLRPGPEGKMQIENLEIPRGVAIRGLLVRHLVLPNNFLNEIGDSYHIF